VVVVGGGRRRQAFGPRRVNLRDLRYLVAAADTEHFGRAAERCHVSQPTLSGQIRKLEDTLGIALFERSHRSVALTEAGREITEHARDILERVRRMEELALSRRDALVGPLRIGVIPTLCAYLLPHLLPTLRANSPTLRPVLSEEITAVLLERLRAHEIDVALVATREDEDDLVETALFDEPLWLAMPAGHPLAAGAVVGTAELADPGLPVLTLAEGHCLADRVRELCSIGTGPVLDADLRATSLETLLQLVVAGRGVTLVPALAVASLHLPGVVCRALSVTGGNRRIALLRRRSSSRLPAIEAFERAVLECLPPLDGEDPCGGPRALR